MGMINAAADAILAAFPVLSLAAAPEPEWEYRCTNEINTTEIKYGPDRHRAQCSGLIERRRKAGPWEPLPVVGETDGE